MPIAQSDGLPIGMQITDGFFEDRTTIAFASLVEREFGGLKAPPALGDAERRQPLRPDRFPG
jgi:amidase